MNTSDISSKRATSRSICTCNTRNTVFTHLTTNTSKSTLAVCGHSDNNCSPSFHSLGADRWHTYHQVSMHKQRKDCCLILWQYPHLFPIDPLIASSSRPHPQELCPQSWPQATPVTGCSEAPVNQSPAESRALANIPLFLILEPPPEAMHFRVHGAVLIYLI